MLDHCCEGKFVFKKPQASQIGKIAMGMTSYRTRTLCFSHVAGRTVIYISGTRGGKLLASFSVTTREKCGYKNLGQSHRFFCPTR